MNKFLVKTSARTGSHLLYSYLMSTGLTGYHTDFQMYEGHRGRLDKHNRPLLTNGTYLNYQNDNVVIHDHTNWLPSDTENWHIIYTKRLDTIKQTISFLWAEHTSEYVAAGVANKNYSYTNKIYEPIELDLETTLQRHTFRTRTWERDLEKTFLQGNWKKADILYLETFLKKTPQTVAAYLGIPQIDFSWDSQKNPRDVEKYIINYSEVYNFLEQNRL